jgi:NAD(P)-dependent dehydrogenase (short-subunit alcohol dehydrogenase family)
MSELRFDGRSVIVTGAGRGIGRCHAMLLASRGAQVVVADLGGRLDGTGSSSDPADEVVKEIEAAGGTAVACYASVADEAGAASIVQAALDTFGRLDVVVNNAGIADPDWFEDLSLERYRRMVEVHFLGTVNVVKAAYPHLIAGGYGRIVNTCSEAGFGLVPKATSYGGAKGGVYGFTRSLAQDSIRHGILVNAVVPRASTRLSGPSVLAKTYDLPGDSFAEVMQRFAPELVSPAAVFLAHESCTLNGELLVSGGGQVHRIAAVMTKGIGHEQMTPEVVAQNLAALMDMTDAQTLSLGAHQEQR